jgi:hypothetical protein
MGGRVWNRPAVGRPKESSLTDYKMKYKSPPHHRTRQNGPIVAKSCRHMVPGGPREVVPAILRDVEHAGSLDPHTDRTPRVQARDGALHGPPQGVTLFKTIWSGK